jgi:hypothetical protein
MGRGVGADRFLVGAGWLPADVLSPHLGLGLALNVRVPTASRTGDHRTQDRDLTMLARLG